MIRQAKENDINRLIDLYMACIRDLDAHKIFQWNDKYPSSRTITDQVEAGSQFLYEVEGDLVGAVCLNQEQAKEWARVNWWPARSADKILIIHGLVVSPMHQGKGYGQSLLELSERYARDMGYLGLRLDAFSENLIARKLYEKNHYTKVGEVDFDDKPEGHQRYYCYEKQL